MRIIIDNDITIEEHTKNTEQWCRDNLTIDNPDFYKRQRMGMWTRNVPRSIQLYERHGDSLKIPFGCLREVWQMFREADEGSTYDYRIMPIEGRKYNSHINLYDYQETAVQHVLSAKNGILVMPCGSGKGLPVDAKICTPTGWKRNGDLRIGDAVVGSDGKATRVTGIFDRGKVDAYKITFSDGVETVCDKDHLWTVQKQSQRFESHNWDVMSAQAIYEHYQNMKCRSQYLYIPIVKPVEFYAYDKISMNPWLLGFLLGDGCFQKTMITMSTSEDDMLEKVIDIIRKKYGSCERLTHIGKYDWRFCGRHVLHDIQSFGLGHKHSYEKFIPPEYLYGSIETRLAVLQGLFDADGHISNGTVFEYCTTSKQLADDVVFIIESLGGTAKVSEKIPKYTYAGEKRTGRKAYRIFFKLYKFKPFTSKKHSAAYRERTHYKEAYRIIKKIEPCEPIISRCITVDAKDQLYVTEHFVVTHNTQCGLEIIARVSGRALWLTHTQDLMNQSMKRAEGVMDTSEGMLGTITEGKVNIGTHITFATIQTMCRLDLERYRHEWDIIIVDECQRCAGSPTRVSQFYKVVNNLSARYKIGLTATPKRSDGLEKSMFALLGSIIYEVPKECVRTCPVRVQTIETGWEPDIDKICRGDGTIDYAKVIEDMTESEERFELVLNNIVDITRGEPTIVLANRVEYLKALCKAYNEGQVGTAVCLSGMGQSKKAKEERKQALEALNNGELDVIFCTYALASEGLDIPNLRYVVLATPEKNPTTIQQSCGRVARKAEGKLYGTVIDFVDDFPMYKSWSAKRLSLYKQLGYNII